MLCDDPDEEMDVNSIRYRILLSTAATVVVFFFHKLCARFTYRDRAPPSPKTLSDFSEPTSVAYAFKMHVVMLFVSL